MIVTGDPDLLMVKEFQGIRMVPPRVLRIVSVANV
jgi:hypothetical protein